MTTDIWDPSSEAEKPAYVIKESFLHFIINKMKTDDSENINDFLSLEEQKKHQAIMFSSKDKWFSAAESLSNEEIVFLIRFFTLAEVVYSGWTAEEKSPVICLGKVLRKRGEGLDKELLKWIKNRNSNKFLPFGPL